MLTDVIVILIFLIFVGLGYTRGLIKSAASLVKISISVIIAFLLSNPISALLNKLFGLSKGLAKLFGTDTSTGKYILIAIVTVILFIAIRTVLHWLVKFAEKSREVSPVFNSLDRWLGALFGALRFAFLFSIAAIAFYLITRLPFLNSLHGTIFKGSKIASWLYDIAINVVLAGALSAASHAIGG